MSTIVHNHEAQLAEALRRCGVEVGSVGGDHFRRVVAGRLLESDWLAGYVEAILAARLARVEALIPKPPVLDDGMIRHDVFSHSGGLQCDLCPNWPHASCVSAYALRAALRSDAHTEQKGEGDG